MTTTRDEKARKFTERGVTIIIGLAAWLCLIIVLLLLAWIAARLGKNIYLTLFSGAC